MIKTRRFYNALTVDVEDYFQVSAFESVIPRSDWGRHPWRVQDNTGRVLELFARAGVRATFFTLGCVAEAHPALVRRIVDAGHELASHGWSHVRVIHQTREEFRADVRRTKALLEDLAGQSVPGYRAASYSIGPRTPWAHEVLAEAGHVYSSSVFPVPHDFYGAPDAPRFPYRPVPGLVEIPLTTVHAFGRNWPCAGGGWFRLLPYAVTRALLGHVNRTEQQPAVFYFHPWEIDPGQPRVAGVGFRTRFRHYLNLRRTEARLARLLGDFSWDRMDRVFEVPVA